MIVILPKAEKLQCRNKVCVGFGTAKLDNRAKFFTMSV